MNGEKLKVFIGVVLLAALVVLGALAGRFAGPALSRTHFLVQVAERLYAEDALELDEDTLQTKAFRISGLPPEQLFADARQVRDKFRTATAWFGVWCGLVLGLKLLSILTYRRPVDYEASQGECLSCSRCYLSCPIERKRLSTLEGAKNPAKG